MKIDATRLKKLRKAANLSQEQLSEKSGLSLRTIQRLENDGNACNLTLWLWQQAKNQAKQKVRSGK